PGLAARAENARRSRCDDGSAVAGKTVEAAVPVPSGFEPAGSSHPPENRAQRQLRESELSRDPNQAANPDLAPALDNVITPQREQHRLGAGRRGGAATRRGGDVVALPVP